MKKESLILFLAWLLCALTIAKFLYSVSSLEIMAKKLFIVLVVLFSLSGFALADVGILSKGISTDIGVSVVSDTQGQNKIIMYRDIPIEVNYDKGVLIVQGRKIPIIVDYFGEKDSTFKITDPKSKDWVNLSDNYNRFNLYIEPNYYANNTDELNLLFDRFEPRFELLESLTGWSSEEFYNEKLDIYVESAINCGWGRAFPGEAQIFLREDLSNPDGCKGKYYIDGIGYYDLNPGQLGDHWKYMALALHESLHSINPLPIYPRDWLTEGWSEYYQLNILSTYEFEGIPDINQETADHYLYVGYVAPAYYSWELYIANDYHDTSPYQREIQESEGYDITAWMFSMLRDNYNLLWENFYSIVDNNPETLDESMVLGDYYTDTHIIDLFERATGFEMEPVFRYDGPSGPGWGVRQWESLDWYADIVPVLSVSDANPIPGQSISLNATIYNYGDVGLNNVNVRFYSEIAGESRQIISEQTINVNANSFTKIDVPFSSSTEGSYVLSVVVDEEDLKIESDNSNNEDSETVTFAYMCGDANADKKVDVGDVVYLINYLYKNGAAPLCNPIERCGDASNDGIVDVGDVVYLINYLYKNGPAPCAKGGKIMPVKFPTSYDGAVNYLKTSSKSFGLVSL